MVVAPLEVTVPLRVAPVVVMEVAVPVVTVGTAITVNVAVTLFALVTATVHSFKLVLSHPVQLVKPLPLSAVGVRTTDCPSAKLAEQVAPQVIPAGLLLTLPVPVPFFEMVKVPNDPDCPARTGQT